ncbi:MAG: TIGR00730 family Rossman fold protein, partial [Flammeovirgaceae bacterium]|nr:TIGR00730 family Rossman fold protein [Flammeovirgaceae bacterium]
EIAWELGELLAKKNHTLVYGAGNVGLMGVIADAILEKGGKVTGVIPNFLVEKEVAHKGLTDIITVDSMHERKQIMAEKSDAFIALPGGFGTMDELCEILTWSQLDLHNCPIGLINIGGYFDLLIQFFDKMVEDGFLNKVNRGLILVDETPEGLLDQFKNYTPNKMGKWFDGEKS